METEKRVIRISVRNLVEFVMRSGDLDNRRLSGAEKDAMQAGSRIHRKIQKQMGAGYKAEVSLSTRIDEGEFELLVEGRADGIMTDVSGHVVIDEIKGVYLDIDRLEEPIQVHLAQAMCYGYMYAKQEQLAEIGIQVTYCQLETEDIRRFTKDYSLEELEQWFQGLIHEYVKWANYLYEHELRRDASLKDLQFPFSYRPGQRELAVSVYKAIAREKDLFIQAPTGVGKTLSTVFPAVKAMGEKMADKVFYLTAKSITRTVAEEAFRILREHGMYLNTVVITAKEKLCFQDEISCNPDDCPYARGHFDRVNDAVYEIIHTEQGIGREEILRYAREYQVCPFEFCLDISNWVDGVICDYNYVFDPHVRLKRYFSEGISGNYLFLVDEAHNLVSRGREMYSAFLIKEDVLLTKKILKGHGKLTRALEKVNRLLLEMKREADGYQIYENVHTLALALQALYGELEPFMEEHDSFENRDLVLDFCFQLRDFLTVYEDLGDDYQIYSECLQDGRFLVKLFCMNPARHLKECLEKGRATVFFSATLLPVTYYKELLSGNPEDYAVYVESPFPRENRCLLVASDVSSRYTRRNRREYERVAEYIRTAVQGRKGNYLVFFPSYQYLKEVEEIWKQRMEEQANGKLQPESDAIHWLSQDSHMREEEREAFLQEFEKERNGTFVGFCVMGGIFSEGIDLKEDRLIGVVIVGTGLPMVCTEQELLKGYFEKTNQKGFDYAYQYPGMNKVMQAAGRVIRTMDDEGIILLLDDRFLRREYQEMFPREWWPYQIVNRENVGKAIEDFWREREKQ